jgi:alkylation response protein AidB-like acyl-CoA dehydrogenase
MGELGLLGLPFPSRYGGMEQDWRSVALVNERLAYHAGIASTLFATTVSFGGMSLMTFASEQQRQTLLPRLVQGQARFALALTESGAGSDAAALSTHAQRVQEGWRIHGRKVWISNADAADHLVVACRTTLGSTGTEGISLFLVPRHTPGIHMSLLEKVGHNCMPSWDIGFDDVVVPEDALFGQEGMGFKHVLSTLQYSRAGQAANSIGQAQRAVELARDFAQHRIQFGRPIGNFQVIQHKLADMQVRVNQARLCLYQLAWLIARKRPCRLEAAQAKLVASEAFQFVTRKGLQIMASHGYAMESDMQRMWRDAGLFTFGEGTSEIQRNLIAREMGL